MKRPLTRTLSFVLALALMASPAVGLGAWADTAASDTETEDTSVTLNETSLSFSLGDDDENKVLTATVKLGTDTTGTDTGDEDGDSDDGTDREVSVAWSSSDSAVAGVTGNNSTVGDITDGTFTSSATVTAIGVGKATITAAVKVDGKVIASAECSVEVTLAPVREITITGYTTPLAGKGKTVQLSANVVPPQSASQITWSSSDTDVAAVDQTGLVTAVGPGSAVITVTSPSGITATKTVVVSGVVIYYEQAPIKDCIEVQEGAQKDVTLMQYGSAVPSGGTSVTISWAIPETLYATVSGNGNTARITGKSVGETTLNVTVRIGNSGNYTDSCTVKVVQNTSAYVYSSVPSGGAFCLGDLISSGGQETTAGVSTSLNESCQKMLGEESTHTLYYLTNLNVSTSEGTLYYGYRSSADTGMGVGYSEVYYVGAVSGTSRSLKDVWFVPKPGFGDTATIKYTGADTAGNTYNGGIKLKVTAAQDVSYTAGVGEEVFFAADDFNTVCQNKLGRALQYVTFELPAETRGKLVYNIGSANGFTEDVKSGQAFYRNQSYYLDNVSFIPADDFSGVVKIKYSAVDISGGSFTGAVTITVSGGSGTGDEGNAADINYAAPEDTPVKFRADDFNERCKGTLGDTQLDYVRFTLPDSSKGVLKYTNTEYTSFGTNVQENLRYYYSVSSTDTTRPSLDNVWFEPAEGFSGTAYIDFEGYSVEGHPFTGTVRVLVDNESGGGVINYTSENGRPVSFNPADFNENCVEINNEVLNYVIFDAPSSGQGTLYYNYSTTTGSGSEIDSDSTLMFYRNDKTKSHQISDVTFVPKRGYNGDVMITFKGETMMGTEINGTVHVYVSGNDERTIYYSVIKGGVVDFKSSDFDAISRAYTGESLSYVNFTIPSSGKGTLIYDYDWDGDTFTSAVSGSTNYYCSPSTTYQKDLGKVSFKAPTNTGTYSVSYKGHSAKSSFEGTVYIRVVEPEADPIVYAGTMEPTAMFSSDFENACSDLMGRELDRVVFSTLPDSGTEGRVYRNYTSPSMHGAEAAAGEVYYAGSERAPSLDDLTFVPKAEHGGRVTLSYTGYDSSGRSFTGSVYIDISNKSTSGKFTDMTYYDWAAPSVDFLTGFGIITGMSDHEFAPANPITRADYIVMLCRSFRLNTGGTSTFPDVSSGSYYAWAIATAETLGITPNDGGYFYPEVPITRQDSMVFTQRAMRAAGQSAPDGDGRSLVKFSDCGQVSDYARGAVSMMVDMGMVVGDTDNRLNPLNNISRAEAAIFLHRVLTK